VGPGFKVYSEDVAGSEVVAGACVVVAGAAVVVREADGVVAAGALLEGAATWGAVEDGAAGGEVVGVVAVVEHPIRIRAIINIAVTGTRYFFIFTSNFRTTRYQTLRAACS
jgi:hypothetical protein